MASRKSAFSLLARCPASSAGLAATAAFVIGTRDFFAARLADVCFLVELHVHGVFPQNMQASTLETRAMSLHWILEVVRAYSRDAWKQPRIEARILPEQKTFVLVMDPRLTKPVRRFEFGATVQA